MHIKKAYQNNSTCFLLKIFFHKPFEFACHFKLCLNCFSVVLGFPGEVYHVFNTICGNCIPLKGIRIITTARNAFNLCFTLNLFILSVFLLPFAKRKHILVKILFTRCYSIRQSPVQVQTFPHYTHKKRTDIIISSQLPLYFVFYPPFPKLYVPNSGTSIYKKRTQSKTTLNPSLTIFI